MPVASFPKSCCADGHRKRSERSASREGAKGGCVLLSAPRRSKVRFASTFLCKKSHPSASLLLLFHKKSRSAHLFGCKRPHDDSLSLPTFCEFYYCRVMNTRPKHSVLSPSAFFLFLTFYIDFICQKEYIKYKRNNGVIL